MDTEQTLTKVAFNAVLEMIKLGDLQDGAVVNERRLADQLGLSRTPVREALGRLEGQNFLRRSGRTLLVNGVALSDILEIMSVRMGLESEAARLASGRMTGEKIAALRQSLNSLDNPTHIDAGYHWEVDDLLHLSIAESTGNSLLLRLIRDLRLRTRMFGKDKIPNRFSPGKSEHLAILDAIESGASETAAKLMRDHIEGARAAIVQSLTQERAQ